MMQTVADAVAVTGPVMWKDAAQAAESLVKALGIIVAAWWTYALFVRQRQRYPRASLSLSVTSERLEDGRLLLLVAAELKNVGSTLIRIRTAELCVYRMAPLSAEFIAQMLGGYSPLTAGQDCQLALGLSGHRLQVFTPGQFEIEPGESDRCLYELVIKRDIARVRVTVHIDNIAKRRTLRAWVRGRPATRIGWHATVYHDTASLHANTAGESRLSFQLSSSAAASEESTHVKRR